MSTIIQKPTIIKAAGNKIKNIEEFFGLVNSKTSEVSIARMKSPQGWEEPGQCAGFNEYSIVLKGILVAATKDSIAEIHEGQALFIGKGEWVKYSTPHENGAEYISVCMPAFSPEIVNRDK
jgi:mannose-6-phosphate isomerase-like protein (cupin superfamily)